ncbi:MAG TPA: hypothetical protein VFG71_00865 [Nitrospiraceae bacterium]|nr:hypothetical protein [Nitrospiraceae bacterium]
MMNLLGLSPGRSMSSGEQWYWVNGRLFGRSAQPSVDLANASSVPS